jgi:hypothetical protein
MTAETVNVCKDLGYTDEQSELVGQIDDLFERAVELDLCTGDEAIIIGQACGRIFGKHTGKL